MNVLKENPLAAQLAKPLGQKSLSSSLAVALKIARVALSVAFAIVAVGAVFAIPLCILVATNVVPAKVLNSPNNNVLALWTVAIPTLVYAFVATRGALSIVRRLEGVFASFVANQPFARDNAAHLRAIWVTLVVIEITRITAYILMHGLTAAFFSASKVTFPNTLGDPIDLVRWFVIFVVLILVEVFRQGTQLSEETELTV
ncbi:MAG TPA: hypothetical protein VIY90_11580 [Steroidobacteraceae bacterium]